MFNESPFTGACAYSLFEVIAMLLGTLLLGLLLGFLIWGWLKKRVKSLEHESGKWRRISNLRHAQAAQLTSLVATLKDQLERAETRISLSEYKLRRAHEDVDALHEQLDALNIGDGHASKQASIYRTNYLASDEEPTLADISRAMDTRHDISQQKEDVAGAMKSDEGKTYLEDASRILGRSIFENDLTAFVGIDAHVRDYLLGKNIANWDQLAQLNSDALTEIVVRELGENIPHEPKTWIIQARMATRGEWRKLKVYQDTLQ